ncbi:MAG: AAA family ATPase [Ignavibacteria bacterium]|nr:AAA family ATPase [Ignavibacteria bacterium]
MKNRLPLGLQNFDDLRRKKKVYVDKTAFIAELISDYKIVFLSRPRRFGKSLLLSTIKELFSGNRDSFEGLYIHDRVNVEKLPVILLDFSLIANSDADTFKKSIIIYLQEIAREYSVEIDTDVPQMAIFLLVNRIHTVTGKKTVILIDEYDKPIVDHITNPAKASENREILQGFFGAIKGLDQFIEFLFITGVSKFSKVSLFSGFNQLTDISYDPRFNDICGYTQEELQSSFTPELDKLNSVFDAPREKLMEQIKYWYNGYSWDGKNTVYNPVSILNLFRINEFQNYWFATGTPTFLLKKIKEDSVFIPELEALTIDSTGLESFDIENISLRNLLLQTGYLTVKGKTSGFSGVTYTLGYPNYEVKDAFYSFIYGYLTERKVDEVNSIAARMKKSLIQQNPDLFLSDLKYLFAQIPSMLYISEEKYFHSLFITIAFLIGLKVESEVSTNIGRIDTVLELEDKYYLLEFKYCKSAQSGIDQIKDKRYAEKYLRSGKQIIFVSLAFTRHEITMQTENFRE